MANDCLVTKLKSVVNNDNLPELNSLLLTSYAGADGTRRFVLNSSGASLMVHARGNGYFDGDPSKKEVSTSQTNNIVFSNGDYTMTIKNKYNILNIRADSGPQFIGFNIEELEYCEHLNLAHLASTKCYGDVKKLAKCITITNLLLAGTQVVGDVKYLGLPLLTSLTIPFGVYGSVEDFVLTCIQNGRASRSTSERLNVGSFLDKITFGGVKQTSIGSVHFLTWESASKIVIYEGGDPGVGSSYTKVYAKGATAEEIAAWEQAGKTVVVVS